MRRGFWRCNFIPIHSLSTCRDLFNLKLFFYRANLTRVPSDPSDYRPWHLAFHWHSLAALDSLQVDPAGGLSCGLSWAWCRVSTCQILYLHVSVMETPCGGLRLWHITGQALLAWVSECCRHLAPDSLVDRHSWVVRLVCACHGPPAPWALVVCRSVWRWSGSVPVPAPVVGIMSCWPISVVSAEFSHLTGRCSWSWDDGSVRWALRSCC